MTQERLSALSVLTIESKLAIKLDFDEVIESFRGAQVMGKSKNVQGQMMKNYIKNLDQPDFFDEPVKFEVLEDLKSLKVEAFDTLVIQLKKDDLDFLEYAITLVSVSKKDNFVVLLILENEKDYRKAIYKLGYWEEQMDVKVCSLFFDNKANDKSENLIFSVLFGKFCFSSQVRSFNLDIKSSLKDIVASASPPAAKIAFATIHKNFSAMIHDDVNSSQITYLAPKIILDRLKLKGLDALEDLDDDGAGSVNKNVSKLMGQEKGESVESGVLVSEKSDLKKQSSTSSVTY